MNIQITIECDNACFYNEPGEHNPRPELSRILHKLANDIGGYGVVYNKLYDFNGNYVGFVDIDE